MDRKLLVLLESVALLTMALTAPAFAQDVYEVSGSVSIRIDIADVQVSESFEYHEFVSGSEIDSLEIDAGSGYIQTNSSGDFDSYDTPDYGFRAYEGAYVYTSEGPCYFPEDWDDSSKPYCQGVLDIDHYGYGSDLGQLGITFGSNVVAGCKTVNGTVSLSNGPAEKDLEVRLYSNLSAVALPLSVVIPAGDLAATFRVPTTQVSSPQDGYVGAGLEYLYASDVWSEVPLVIRPVGVATLRLSPTTVVGGHGATGKVTLECRADLAPVMIDLSSSHPGVAGPVAASIVVPQALKTQEFAVVSVPVGSKRVAQITASANGTDKSKSLAVISAASVSSSKLVFANQPINTTSAPLSVVLYNKGVVNYALDALTVTGTQPKMFVPTHNCPTIVPAGGSCTIQVTFTPISTGKKAAQINISTSAKDVSLVVKMTGTGI